VRRFSAALFAVVLTSLASTLAQGAEAPDGGPVDVRFSYPGPAAWSGDFQGACKAVGIQFHPQTQALDFSSKGGQLITRWTRVNYTVVNSPENNPWITARPDRQWSETDAVPAGAGRLAWAGEHGLATAFSQLPWTPETLRLDVEYRATDLRAGSLDFDGNVPGWWDTNAAGELYFTMLDYPGWNREFRHTGTAEAGGDAAFYLRQAVLDVGDWRHELPPYGTVESDVTAPFVQQRTVVYAEAWLTLQDAQFLLPETGVAVCRTLSGVHQGSFVAAMASGEAHHGQDTIPFADRALSLEGRFDVDESPADVVPSDNGEGTTEARARGAITVVGIDFARVGGTGNVPDVAKIGILAALVLAVAAALYKWGGAASAFFYSRLSRDEVLETARRDSILQAIRENPGIAQKDLRTLTALPKTSLHYHLRVLDRAGFVTVQRYGLSRRLFACDTTPKVDRAALALVADDRLAFVRELLRSGPVPLKGVVQALRERFGVSGARAYATIDRAVQAGLARKQRTFPGLALAAVAEEGGSR
jgi:DNA-binding transcriptional ArsR family regulator